MNYYRVRNPTSKATLSFQLTEDALSRKYEKGHDYNDEAQTTIASDKLHTEELIDTTNYIDSS